MTVSMAEPSNSSNCLGLMTEIFAQPRSARSGALEPSVLRHRGADARMLQLPDAHSVCPRSRSPQPGRGDQARGKRYRRQLFHSARAYVVHRRRSSCPCSSTQSTSQTLRRLRGVPWQLKMVIHAYRANAAPLAVPPFAIRWPRRCSRSLRLLIAVQSNCPAEACAQLANSCLAKRAPCRLRLLLKAEFGTTRTFIAVQSLGSCWGSS